MLALGFSPLWFRGCAVRELPVLVTPSCNENQNDTPHLTSQPAALHKAQSKEYNTPIKVTID